jgi:hypothetical protein
MLKSVCHLGGTPSRFMTNAEIWISALSTYFRYRQYMGIGEKRFGKSLAHNFVHYIMRNMEVGQSIASLR